MLIEYSADSEIRASMRIFSILAAICVGLAIYGLVLKRDVVFGIVGGFANQGSAGWAPEANEPAPNAPDGQDTPNSDVVSAVESTETVAESTETVAESTETVAETTETVAETTETAPDAAAEPVRTVRVVAIRSESDTIQNAITLRGTTEAARFVDVKSETSGLVISEPKRKGASVHAGETICSLDAGAKNAALEEASARFNEAEINKTAASELAKEGYASKNRETAAQASLRSAKAAVERAELDISRLTITAPFDGLLETDAAELGSLLQPGSLCATIIQLDPIKVVGYISEVDVEYVKVGNRARITLLSGRQVQGTVTYISRSADSQTRTFRLEIAVENTDLSIRDGATAEIAIESNSETAHLIPQSSLTLNGDGDIGIRAALDDTAKFYPVKIIRDTAEGMWVSGLPDRIDVIVVGHEYVVDGSSIETVFQESDN